MKPKIFTGLKPPQKTAEAEGHYLGEPCIHLKHSGDEGTAQAWRNESDHSCKECENDIEAGFFTMDIEALIPSVRKLALNFWLKVEINEWQDCWRWRGKPNSQRHYLSYWPRPSIKSHSAYHPIHVMNWLVRGDIGRKGTISLCNEGLCVNPLHQIPAGLVIPQYDIQMLEEQKRVLETQINEFSRPKLEIKKSLVQVYDPERVSSAYTKYLKQQYELLSDNR